MNRRDGVGGDKRTQHMGGERRREAGGGGRFSGGPEWQGWGHTGGKENNQNTLCSKML